MTRLCSVCGMWVSGSAKCYCDRDDSRDFAIAQKPPGPGTILQRKIKQFGYKNTEGCGCEAMVAKMNRWGVSRCRENIDEIVQHLEKAATKTGWLERMAVTVPIVKDFARKAIRDLIDEAINEAEALENGVDTMDARTNQSQRVGDAVGGEEQVRKSR